jgi:YfiH family protein
MRQVHGTEVQAIDGVPGEPRACDGLATRRKRLALVVKTADCVPLILWDREKKAVAAVHAGWRGALAGVSRRAVAFLEERFGSRLESIHVAMGPAIGACCYEVGDEVVRAFSEKLPYAGDLFFPGPRGKNHLDLIEANRRQLTEAGIPGGQIYLSGMCTSCENRRLYSYRREGKGVGRLMGVIGIA